MDTPTTDMQDDVLSRPGAAPRGMGARGVAAVVAAALLAGAVIAGWVGWRSGWIDINREAQPPLESAAPQPMLSAAASPAATPAPNPTASIDEANAKLAALEARMAELNRQADAASGNATQAEALLVAFAARRMIERGQPLGYLEGQLRLRFGESQPGAVKRVIEAARNPVTIDELSQGLAAMGPELVGSVPDESSWSWLKRQLGELVVIRHDDKPSPAPKKRLERARLFLAGGRVDAAIAEVERLPGREIAGDWIAQAKSYVATQQALDQLETAAILSPQAPASVRPAPKPLAAPSAGASPSPGASPSASASATPNAT
ncbi:mitofilin family membrane protein [Novosphingobium sp. ZN18A2]|uniref:mitofilin family membrane protein n=1 Tax=Novosphingobium sp. ZN18A2 TaxID=3079861 RepID=UPI0030D1C121